MPTLGQYVGNLNTRWQDDGKHMILLADYSYVDSSELEWPVPVNAMVDGASIPRFLWTAIGGPFEGKYRAASVIHDWYCDVRTRTWMAVDRMFFEAMLTSGVDTTLAKAMFYAVWVGGPRWDLQAMHNTTVGAQLPPVSNTHLNRANFSFLIGSPPAVDRHFSACPELTSETLNEPIFDRGVDTRDIVNPEVMSSAFGDKSYKNFAAELSAMSLTEIEDRAEAARRKAGLTEVG